MPLLTLSGRVTLLRRRRLAITGCGLAVRRLCAVLAGCRGLLPIRSIRGIRGKLLSIRRSRRRLLPIRSVQRRLLSIRGALGSLRRILILAGLCTVLLWRRRLIAIGRLTRLLVRCLARSLSRWILVRRAWIRCSLWWPWWVASRRSPLRRRGTVTLRGLLTVVRLV